ncbi:MAG: KTSC domain-containing protein [Clostridiaceae bacterium]
MEMQYVESSNLAAVGYDPNSAILQIEFKDGSAYEYYDVPQFEFDELMSSDSKGKYAHVNIYKRYSQQKIR